MSFEVQELSDVIRIIVLICFGRETRLTKSSLKRKVENYLAGKIKIEMGEMSEALRKMVSEGLLIERDGVFELTAEGNRLSKEWRSLLIKREPVLEFVAGLTDGTITSLIVIISAFLAKLPLQMTSFAAVLTVTAAAVSNFSSFMLGGKTEDVADLLVLKALMDYSLRDIPDKEERIKSLKIIKHLFIILRREITKSNLLAALVCSTTTFLAGIIPIAAFFALPQPFGFILAIIIVGAITLTFLVHYRTKKTRVPWKITLLETLVIVAVAIIASLIIGSGS